MVQQIYRQCNGIAIYRPPFPTSRYLDSDKIVPWIDFQVDLQGTGALLNGF